MNSHTDRIGGFYFAFPRLVQRLLGGTGHRSTNNWIEACGAGVFIYLISYFYAVAWFELRRDSLLSVLLLVPLIFGVWIFWLIVVYLNSLLIKMVRIAGWLRGADRVRAQSFLITALTTFFAFEVVRMNSIARWFALVWFVLVALNLFSAAVLPFLSKRAEPKAP